MKKSNALMLSYMVFLVLSILAHLVFHWQGLDRIAIAATIAGCFFAFSDLSNWYVSYQTPFIDAVQKDFDNLVGYCAAVITSLHTQCNELTDTIALVTPYKNVFSSINPIIAEAENLIKQGGESEKGINATIQECNEVQLLLDAERKKLKQVHNIEIVLVTLGFIAFFSLLSFDVILNFLIPFQTIATVLAFVVIMLNYYLRDVLEEKSKQEIDVILERVKREQREIEQMVEKAKQTPILDKVKALVERIQRFEEDNGQVNDA